MKISDERLLCWTETYKKVIEMCGKNEVNEEFLSIFTELQQLREERRWRNLSKETPGEPAWCQIRGSGIQFREPLFIGSSIVITVAQNRHSIETIIGLYEKTEWRPLPMDLPEVE